MVYPRKDEHNHESSRQDCIKGKHRDRMRHARTEPSLGRRRPGIVAFEHAAVGPLIVLVFVLGVLRLLVSLLLDLEDLAPQTQRGDGGGEGEGQRQEAQGGDCAVGEDAVGDAEREGRDVGGDEDEAERVKEG